MSNEPCSRIHGPLRTARSPSQRTVTGVIARLPAAVVVAFRPSTRVPECFLVHSQDAMKIKIESLLVINNCPAEQWYTLTVIALELATIKFA